MLYCLIDIFASFRTRSHPLLLFYNNLTPELAAGILLAVLVGMTVHEFAHNYVAYLMGDMTPIEQGRLTFNPMVHIYWPGFIMFVLIGFGILGSAPINYRRMRNPRWGYLAAVAAGPFSNLLIAIIAGIILRVMIANDILLDSSLVVTLVLTMIRFNILLFIFNLLPLHPLDGWSIVYTLLPPAQADAWARNAQLTGYVFLALILLSFFPLLPPELDPLNLIIREPLRFIERLILGF